MQENALSKKNLIALLIINMVTVILFFLAWIETMSTKKGALIASGFAYLRYYTVISNALFTVTSLVLAIIVICMLAGKASRVPRAVFMIKYISASMLSVTFWVVLVMLAPRLGIVFLFSGANFWYHFIIPFISIGEFILLDRFGKISFKETFLTLIPTLIYAAVYITNVAVNGRTPANDFYGILNWGLPVGILILLFIMAVNWGSALLLRFGRGRRG